MKLLIAIGSVASRLLNVLLLGDPDMTFSARVYFAVISGKKAWRPVNAAINWLFWALTFGRVRHHTRLAVMHDMDEARRVIAKYEALL